MAAAVWEDGSWYGSAEVIARIRALREAAVAGYDRDLELLGKGLEQRWGREQYMVAMQAESDRNGGNVNATDLSDRRREVLAASRVSLMFPWDAIQEPEARGTQAELDGVVKAVIALLSKNREELTRQLSVWPVQQEPAKPVAVCGKQLLDQAGARPPKPN